MTLPVWMLLGFAVWTIVLLFVTVGVYRWSRILSGRVEIKDIRADRPEGREWYLRSLRAHANCVENLPLFAVIVFAMHVSQTTSPAADAMSVAVLAARVCQSTTHVAFVQTNAVALVRFLFFLTQVVCFLAMAGIVVAAAVG